MQGSCVHNTWWIYLEVTSEAENFVKTGKKIHAMEKSLEILKTGVKIKSNRSN